MAYRLEKGEPVPDGLKRIVRDEIDSAVGLLRGKRKASRDEAIHEARKSIKKVRAILKLVRAELGELYTPENAELRDIARKLSGFRDAAAMIETFRDLKRSYAESIAPARLSSFGTALARAKKQAAASADFRNVLTEAESALRRIGENAATWPLKTDGFGAIQPGLKETYRRGRKALVRARTDPSPENYHELRKRAKDLLYQGRVLGIEKDDEKSLKDLETSLGDDHNLALLRIGIPSFGNLRNTDLVLSLIDRHQKKLRDDALASADRIYKEKPREFVRRMKLECIAAEVDGATSSV
jgi:CHAD domain-containing protein